MEKEAEEYIVYNNASYVLRETTVSRAEDSRYIMRNGVAYSKLEPYNTWEEIREFKLNGGTLEKLVDGKGWVDYPSGITNLEVNRYPTADEAATKRFRVVEPDVDFTNLVKRWVAGEPLDYRRKNPEDRLGINYGGWIPMTEPLFNPKLFEYQIGDRKPVVINLSAYDRTVSLTGFPCRLQPPNVQIVFDYKGDLLSAGIIGDVNGPE